MIPALKDSHLVVYVLFLSVLVAIAITGTVLFDDKVQRAKDGDNKVLVLTVAQKTTPLMISVLVANVIIVESGYFFIVDIPRSQRVKRGVRHDTQLDRAKKEGKRREGRTAGARATATRNR